MSEMKDRLKELRKTLNLKQREVAEKLEVSTGQIGIWEAGTAELPRARIYQLCKEYNVRREWLETGVGEMFEPGKTLEDKLADAASALFEALTDNGKKAVLKAMREKLGIPDDAPRSAIESPRQFPEKDYHTVAKNDRLRGDGENA